MSSLAETYYTSEQYLALERAAEYKSEVETKVTAVRDAHCTEDVDQIKRSTDELSQSMQRIGQAMYAQQQATAGTRGPGFDNMGGTGEPGGNGTEPGKAADEGT